MTRLAAIAIVCLPVVGCAQPAGLIRMGQEQPTWPADAPAKVRYLGAIEADWGEAVDRSAGRSLRTFFFGPEPARRFVTPHAVAMHPDGKRLAVADTNGRSVHVLDFQANTAWTVAVGREVPFALGVPTGVTWAGERLCITDAEEHQVIIVEPSGGTRAIGRDHLERPAGIAYNRANGLLYVSDAKANRIVVMDPDGNVVYRFGARGSGSGELNTPAQLECTQRGEVWVADALNFRVQRFSQQGEPLGGFGVKGDASGDFALPKGITVDADENVWVVDAQFENVQVFDATGRLLLTFGREGRGPGEFWLPAGADIDQMNRLWVADGYNRRVQLFEILP